MTNPKPFQRVSQVRHAVSTLVSAERSLVWLRSQLVISTANNLRDRHRRVIKLATQNPHHAGAAEIMRHSTHEAERSRGWFDALSLEAYLSYRLFHNSYIYVGTGVSLPVRLSRQKTLIDRARRLTQGSDKIDWFLDGVASELTRFIDSRYFVTASLEEVEVGKGRRGEAIRFHIRRVPRKEVGGGSDGGDG